MPVTSRTNHEINKYQVGFEATKDINEIFTGKKNVVVVTAAYTALPTDNVIILTATTATVTLPAYADVEIGKEYKICCRSTAAGMQVGRAADELINGVSANVTLASSAAATLLYAGTTVGWIMTTEASST